MSKKLQRLVGELEMVLRIPSPESEAKARELSDQIAKAIPKTVPNKALAHPQEVRRFIHPQDVESHPVFH